MNVTTHSLDLPERAPWAARTLFSLLSRLAAGRLVLVTPEGIRRTFIGTACGPSAVLVVREWGAIGAMLRRAEIGVFESWRDGRIATPDMTAFLELCAANESALADVFHGHPVSAWLLRMAHRLRPNTRAGSRKNIHAHYDLGNDFYQLWLDRTMSYSSAIFPASGSVELESASDAKNDRILATLGVERHHELLEIGCGWGGFAERAATTTGCHVTGLTISPAQLEFAKKRIEGAGLTDRVDLRFCDYRDSAGQFDRVVSIEMVEAVGERYWPTYFSTVRERLKPGGRAMIQSIVIAEEAFENYRSTSDFIREYIFPGGMLPTVARIGEQARSAGLAVREVFPFGGDYAQTLRRWRTRFDACEAEVRALGFDDAFLAAWRFYFHYCEAGFNAGRVSVVQVELERPM